MTDALTHPEALVAGIALEAVAEMKIARPRVCFLDGCVRLMFRGGFVIDLDTGIAKTLGASDMKALREAIWFEIGDARNVKMATQHSGAGSGEA